MEVGEMNDLVEFFPLFFQGVAMTLQISIAAISFSYIVGTLFGVLTCNHLKIPIISPMIEVITFILRAVPFYVQLLIVYFVLPDLIGYNFDPFLASILALGMCSSGYIARITGGGINSLSLSKGGMNIIFGEMQPMPIYLGVASFYICLSFLLNLCTRYLERRFSYAKT